MTSTAIAHAIASLEAERERIEREIAELRAKLAERRDWEDENPVGWR